MSLILEKKTTCLNIAVVVHCHYLMMANMLIDRLLNIPYEFDLFITTSCDTVSEAIATKVSTINQMKSCDIFITPNRGRNFAPFLVEFAKDLENYDLFCHLHTKQSYHTNEFSGWGSYLIENLVGRTSIVEYIVERFASDPTCGLLYPKTYPAVPSWAQSWLGNRSIAQVWCEQNGVNLNFGPLAFPTGGMFWVRPSSIRQLLRYEWTYSHFPAEEGQIDGTMQHAIERLVGALTDYNGFSQLAFDPPIGVDHHRMVTRWDNQ